jgi:hypothetical protein
MHSTCNEQASHAHYLGTYGTSLSLTLIRDAVTFAQRHQALSSPNEDRSLALSRARVGRGGVQVIIYRKQLSETLFLMHYRLIHLY